MKRFALILLALAATAMLSGCWNSSGTAQPSPTASLAPTATADNPVEGALDELATDMPGSLEGGAATTAPLDENAGERRPLRALPNRALRYPRKPTRQEDLFA